MGSISVLLVDDNPAFLRILARFLQEQSQGDVIVVGSPVVLLTGGDGTGSGNQKKRVLVGAILQKPFQFDEIQTLIGKVTRPRRMQCVVRADRAACRAATQN